MTSLHRAGTTSVRLPRGRLGTAVIREAVHPGECEDCGNLACRCESIRALVVFDRRCAHCPGGGLLTRHGLCTDPYGDKGICYCFASSEQHRLQHEQWIAPDDDDREGADGLDSSRQTVDWQDEAKAAAAHAARIGAPI